VRSLGLSSCASTPPVMREPVMSAMVFSFVGPAFERTNWCAESTRLMRAITAALTRCMARLHSQNFDRAQTKPPPTAHRGTARPSYSALPPQARTAPQNPFTNRICFGVSHRASSKRGLATKITIPAIATSPRSADSG
jgi:hypothetical protein